MKSATGLTGTGSRDWVVQRISAVEMMLYSLVVLGYLVMHTTGGSHLTYEGWHGFMMSTPMRIFSLLTLLSIGGHGWVGIWTVITDYVTKRHMGKVASPLQLILTTLMILMVLICTIWGFLIFW